MSSSPPPPHTHTIQMAVFEGDLGYICVSLLMQLVRFSKWRGRFPLPQYGGDDSPRSRAASFLLPASSDNLPAKTDQMTCLARRLPGSGTASGAKTGGHLHEITYPWERPKEKSTNLKPLPTAGERDDSDSPRLETVAESSGTDLPRLETMAESHGQKKHTS